LIKGKTTDLLIFLICGFGLEIVGGNKFFIVEFNKIKLNLV